MNKIIKIQIEKKTSDYLYYLFASTEAYKNVLQAILSNNRGIEVNKELFDSYKSEYNSLFMETEILKGEIFKEYFLDTNTSHINEKYNFYIDFLSSEIVVTIEEV